MIVVVLGTDPPKWTVFPNVTAWPK